MDVQKRKAGEKWIREWWRLQPPPFRIILVLLVIILLVAGACFCAEAYYIIHPFRVIRDSKQNVWTVDYPRWLLWGQQSEVHLFVLQPVSNELSTLEVVVPMVVRVDQARLRPPPAEVRPQSDDLYLKWHISPTQIQPGKEPIVIPLVNDQPREGNKISLRINDEKITIYRESLFLERLRRGALGLSGALGLGGLLALLYSSWQFHQQRNERRAREKVGEARKILRQKQRALKDFIELVEDVSRSGLEPFWRALPERACLEFLKDLLKGEIRLQPGDSIPCPWSKWATEITCAYLKMVKETINESQASDTEVQLVSWLLQQDWRVLDPDTERALRDTIAKRFSQITSQYEWRQWKTRLDMRQPKTIERETIAEMPNLFPEPDLRAEAPATRWWLFAKGLFWEEPRWLSLSKGPCAAFILFWGPAGQGHTAAALAVGRYRHPPQVLGLYFRQAPTLSRVQRALAEQVLEFLMARAPDLWRLDRAQRTLLWHWLASVLPVASILARLESARQAWWGRASGEQTDVDGEDHIRARYADAVLRVCQAEVPEFRAWTSLLDDAWWAEGRTVLQLVKTQLGHTFQAVWLAWDDPRPSGSSAAEEVPWLSLRERLQTMGLDLRVWWFVESAKEPSLPQVDTPAWLRIPIQWTAKDLRGLLEYRLRVLRPTTVGHLETVYDPEIVAWWLRDRPGCTLRDFVQRWQAAWQEAKQETKQEADASALFERLKEAFRDQFAHWDRCA